MTLTTQKTFKILRCGVLWLGLLSLASCKTINDTESLSSSEANSQSVKAYRSCVFGESIDELRQSPEFVSADKGETKHVSRLVSSSGEILKFQLTEFTHKESKSLFLVYTTLSEDAESGSLIPTGWIEAATNGEIVAEFGDNELTRCSVDTTNVANVPARSDASCVFGEHLGDLENEKFFVRETPSKEEMAASQKMNVLPIKSDIAITEKDYRNLKIQDYKHLKTGTRYTVYTANYTPQASATDKDPATEWPTGTVIGWIAQQPSNEIVGEIVDGTIQNCRRLANGTIPDANSDKLLSDCAVAKEWDDLNDRTKECQP